LSLQLYCNGDNDIDGATLPDTGSNMRLLSMNEPISGQKETESLEQKTPPPTSVIAYPPDKPAQTKRPCRICGETVYEFDVIDGKAFFYSAHEWCEHSDKPAQTKRHSFLPHSCQICPEGYCQESFPRALRLCPTCHLAYLIDGDICPRCKQSWNPSSSL
jgi:hypothetical protein